MDDKTKLEECQLPAQSQLQIKSDEKELHTLLS